MQINKNLSHDFYNKLKSMQAFGESKALYKQANNNTTSNKIFSFNTFKTYVQQCDRFANYIQNNHPDDCNFKNAKQYIIEYLDNSINKGLSAYTINTQAQALYKVYNIGKHSKYYHTNLPRRERVNITRSRLPVDSDKHFSEARNLRQVNFCKATGLRLSELSKIKGCDLYTKEQINTMLAKETDEFKIKALSNTKYFKEQYYVHVKSGKGGKERYVPILEKYEKHVLQTFKEVSNNQRVFSKVNRNADTHNYRSQYATSIYKQYARDINTLPFDKKQGCTIVQSQVYHCRKDRVNDKFDKQAMLITSKALGHNRLDVIASHYLRE